MATLQLKNVKKVYDNKVVAVDNFNLDVADKEFIVFVGPSGCGKSTTLRMIAGLEEISDGEILIDGEVVNDLQPKDRGIAMVFQNYALYPHMTVYDNMAFSLRLKRPKMKEEEIYERVTNAAQILGITDYLMRKPRALSGGQRQRVAIGRAMVRESKVFLMDEPLSNLDAKLRNQMRAEIILLRQKIDSTFIYVTHDQTEALTMGDRIAVINEGKISQIDVPEKIYNYPENTFVGGFLGSPAMNFIPCNVKDGKTEINGTVIDFNGKFKLNDGDVILGVRPENLSLNQSEFSFPVNVKMCEMLGNKKIICFDCNGKECFAEVNPDFNGENVSIGFNSDKILFFNVETGIRLKDCTI